MDRCRQDQLKTVQTARDECEVGLVWRTVGDVGRMRLRRESP